MMLTVLFKTCSLYAFLFSNTPIFMGGARKLLQNSQQDWEGEGSIIIIEGFSLFTFTAGLNISFFEQRISIFVDQLNPNIRVDKCLWY